MLQHNTDEPCEQYAERTRSVTKGQALYDSTYYKVVIQSSQIHGAEGVPGLGGGGGESALNGEQETGPEMDGADGCTTVWVYLMP